MRGVAHDGTVVMHAQVGVVVFGMRDEGERYDAELQLLGYQMAIGMFRRVLY